MRRIALIIQYIASYLYNRDTVSYTVADPSRPTPADSLYLKLCELLSAGDICGAENYLFENFMAGDDYILAALDFYQRLNGMSDEELAARDFSRDEVREGLCDILKKAGMDTSKL
ncbi:MAG: DUF6483 family protein [Eubacteriales bacterium]